MFRPVVSEVLRRCEQVRRVVYVSCNPEDKYKRRDFVVKGGALWDNARVLCGPGREGTPFQLEFAQPVDLFPHTPHVELVCVFDRVAGPFRT